MKGEGPPGMPGWGKEVIGSECRFNLMGVHPCRPAAEPCRKDTLICTNSTLERGGCTDGRRGVHGRVRNVGWGMTEGGGR